MKKIALRIFAVFLTFVFMNFVFMNTVFVHTHFLSDGSVVSHSHPYLPSSHHTHSSASLMSIAQFNAAAATMEGTAYYAHAFYETDWAVISPTIQIHFIEINVIGKALRGPPAV